MRALIRRYLAEHHRKEAKRFSKFLVVGMIGFIVDTGTFNLLILAYHLSAASHLATIQLLGQNVTLNLDWLLAKSISFSLAVTSNFLWNRYWVYPDSRSKRLGHQVTQFVAVSLAGLLITLVVLNTLSNITRPLFSPVLAANLANAGAVLVVLFWNFLVNRLWTYSDVQGSLSLRRSSKQAPIPDRRSKPIST